jgi:hypothetical protein
MPLPRMHFNPFGVLVSGTRPPVICFLWRNFHPKVPKSH